MPKEIVPTGVVRPVNYGLIIDGIFVSPVTEARAWVLNADKRTRRRVAESLPFEGAHEQLEDRIMHRHGTHIFERFAEGYKVNVPSQDAKQYRNAEHVRVKSMTGKPNAFHDVILHRDEGFLGYRPECSCANHNYVNSKTTLIRGVECIHSSVHAQHTHRPRAFRIGSDKDALENAIAWMLWSYYIVKGTTQASTSFASVNKPHLYDPAFLSEFSEDDGSRFRFGVMRHEEITARVDPSQRQYFLSQKYVLKRINAWMKRHGFVEDGYVREGKGLHPFIAYRSRSGNVAMNICCDLEHPPIVVRRELGDRADWNEIEYEPLEAYYQRRRPFASVDDVTRRHAHTTVLFPEFFGIRTPKALQDRYAFLRAA